MYEKNLKVLQIEKTKIKIAIVYRWLFMQNIQKNLHTSH